MTFPCFDLHMQRNSPTKLKKVFYSHSLHRIRSLAIFDRRSTQLKTSPSSSCASPSPRRTHPRNVSLFLPSSVAPSFFLISSSFLFFVFVRFDASLLCVLCMFFPVRLRVFEVCAAFVRPPLFGDLHLSFFFFFVLMRSATHYVAFASFSLPVILFSAFPSTSFGLRWSSRATSISHLPPRPWEKRLQMWRLPP